MKSLLASLTGPQRNHISDVLDLVGLTNQRGALAGALSHGQKAVARDRHAADGRSRAAARGRSPFAGMTPQETERTAALLLSLMAEHTVIVVEHDMDFVRSIAKRVTVLHEGRVLAEGDMEQVQADPRVIETL